MRDSLNNTGTASSGASATTDAAGGPVDNLATGETTVSGTVSGSYTDTQASDDTYEAITEIESGGKPANRHSMLEHTWTINIGSGGSPVLYVEAYHTSNSDGDNFVFAYSSDGSSYTNAITVTKTSDDNSAQSSALPGGLSGTVYIRVTDTDSSAGNSSLDTIYVDDLFIRTTSGGGDPDTDPPTPNPAAFASAPSADSSSAISMTAATGSDVTGPIEYLFTETSGNPGGTSSSWQTSTSYTDSGLDAETQYTYTVTMRDSLNNTGSASSPASATTDAAGPSLPGQASNPSPADGATKLQNPILLSWTAGSGTISHDVYFGTDSTPDSGELQGNQSGTSFDPGNLSGKTRYYWRIDEVNAAGTTTGTVWELKTK
jgi:hypothetical protein